MLEKGERITHLLMKGKGSFQDQNILNIIIVGV
jgi:hypothetical protein